MQFGFGWVISYGLNDTDGQTVLGSIEIENLFAGHTALFLFPLKQLFDLWMFYDADPLVMVEKPLDYFRQRIVIDSAIFVAAEDRFARRRLSDRTRF